MYSKTMQQVNIALNITHKLKQTHYVVFTAFNRKMRHNLRYTNGASEPVTQELPFYDIIHVQVWQINVCLIQLYIGATLVQHLEHKYISHARMRRGDVQKGQLSLLRWSLESWVQETESVQCACVMDTSSYSCVRQISLLEREIAEACGDSILNPEAGGTVGLSLRQDYRHAWALFGRKSYALR